MRLQTHLGRRDGKSFDNLKWTRLKLYVNTEIIKHKN